LALCIVAAYSQETTSGPPVEEKWFGVGHCKNGDEKCIAKCEKWVEKQGHEFSEAVCEAKEGKPEDKLFCACRYVEVDSEEEEEEEGTPEPSSESESSEGPTEKWFGAGLCKKGDEKCIAKCEKFAAKKDVAVSEVLCENPLGKANGKPMCHCIFGEGSTTTPAA